MYRYLIMTVCLLLFVPIPIFAESQHSIKASFIRDGDVWLFMNDKEIQITSSKMYTQSPLGPTMESGFYINSLHHQSLKRTNNNLRYGLIM